jgi:hypothetical protein
MRSAHTSVGYGSTWEIKYSDDREAEISVYTGFRREFETKATAA